MIVAAATSTVAAPAAATVPAGALGVSVRLNSFDAVTPTGPTHVAYPGLEMISAMATWANLEPLEGQFDWSTLDADVEDARTGGYRILLRIMAGRNSPSWLAADGVGMIELLGTDPSSVDYCERLETPLPWDPILRAKYRALMTEVGAWLREPDGAGGTKGDHVFAIPVAMPTFQGTEMQLGYGTNVTCPSGTGGAGSNLAGSNQAAWDAVGSLTERRALLEQAWIDAIDIHMEALPQDVGSLLAYGALFGDQQSAALRLAGTQVPRYPDRLWSMYTNLQPKVRSNGTLGTYREWCAACDQVMMRVMAEHGLLGFQTASGRIIDTSAEFHAAVEDGLATYGMRFLETQSGKVSDEYGYLVGNDGSVQSRILTMNHERPTGTTVACGAVTIGTSSTCTATVLDANGAPITPGGTDTIAWSASAGSIDTASCTPAGGGASASCSITYTPAAVGADEVTAVYGGDSNHLGSGGSAAVSVGGRATSTVVACDASVRVGESAHCSATVRDTGTGSASAPAGDVAWSSGGGSFDAGTCTLVPAGGGTASCSVAFTPAATGVHTITASYGGDDAHSVSAGSAPVTATKRGTATSVTCGTPVVAGSSTTCTATVTDTSAGTASPPGGSGTVSWSSSASGTFAPATCSPVGAGTTASCSVAYTPTTVGTRTVTATYAGDAVHAGGSSTPFTVTATTPPDTTGPTVTITAPSGTTVPKNKVSVLQATATDPSGVASVAFAVGTTVLCTDTTAPYTCSWKVPVKANVTYTLTMTGRDTLGNATAKTKTVKSV